MAHPRVKAAVTRQNTADMYGGTPNIPFVKSLAHAIDPRPIPAEGDEAGAALGASVSRSRTEEKHRSAVWRVNVQEKPQ